MSEDKMSRLKIIETIYLNMKEAVCVNKIVLNDSGNAIDYKITDVNPAFEEITNISKKQAVGKLASDLYGTGEPPFLEIFARVADTGQAAILEVFWPPMNKHFNASVISPQKGFFATIFFDVSEFKKTTEALKISENRFRSITENAVDYIFIKDKERKYTFVNHAMIRLLGLTENEIIGKTPEEIYGPDEGSIVREVDDRTFSGQTVNETRELLIGNEQRAYNTIQTPLTVEDGSISSIMGIVRDVTDSKRLEEQLKQSDKMRAIGQLAGGIAHDFNNQLAGIVGYSELLRKKISKDPKLSFYVDNILLATKRAAELISQLLAFARKGKYLSVPVDIHSIIGEVANILKRTIDKRIIIKQHLDAQQALTLGDPTQIQNAVLNVSLNARDAMQDGGELLFSTSVVEFEAKHCRNHPYEILPGNYIQLCVTDNGIGMDEATKTRIFEPFFSTKEPGKGTGMGLASVYGTMTNHGGAVFVYSEPGHGTTMKLLFPLNLLPKENVGQPENEECAVPGNAHILIVDDEEFVLDTVTRMLEDAGFKTSVCRNGKEAIEFYKNNWETIDLVILDMVMPEINGKDTFIALKKINPEVIAFLSSGYSLNGEAQKILDEGIKAFINKPYRWIELSKLLYKALKNVDAGPGK
ncbi:MAG: PAS domain S-box protein [Candidatus Riflebacteria bacterium]